MRLDPATTQVLVVDFQERLFSVMPDHREEAVKAVENLLFVADGLGLPVVATEQYPKGLGPTLERVRRPVTFEKMAFSALRESGFEGHVARDQVVVVGMETHICVAHTVADLKARGKDVVVVPEGCLSRRDADKARGLALCEQAGAWIAPIETVMFGLLGTAAHPLFREVSKRIK